MYVKFIQQILLLLLIIPSKSSTSDTEDDSVEETLERALEIVRRMKSPTTPRPSRNSTTDSPIDKSARAILNLFGKSREDYAPINIPSTSHEPDDHDDPDYCPEKLVIRGREISERTMRIIVDLHDNGRSEAGIQKKYSWYSRQWLPKLRRCLETGVRPSQAMGIINRFVYDKFKEARDQSRPVRGFMLRNWALQEARRLKHASFVASLTWLSNFKKNYGIRSRKVTKYTSTPELALTMETAQRIQKFRETFRIWKRYFKRRGIWNMDQSGFNYEQSTDRTLSSQGERTTMLATNSRNKRTHSYTTQPMITRDGRILGKLLICMQESSGQFGPRVVQEVRRLEESYSNILVYASKSGKMSSDLMTDWATSLLKGAVDEHKLGPAPGDSDEHILPVSQLLRDGDRGMDDEDDYCYHSQRESTQADCEGATDEDSHIDAPELCRAQAGERIRAECISEPSILLLVDAWAGNRAFARQARLMGIKMMTLPERSTSEAQPLDVGFMRQYKIFVNRITYQALHDGLVPNVTSREGILNMQSLIWNQFGAQSYRSMIRWCWHKTDTEFDESEFEGSPLMKVREIQFGFQPKTCEVDECNEHGFIRCAHCGKIMCLAHFLERECFHETLMNRSHYVEELPFIDDDMNDDIEDTEFFGEEIEV